MSLRIFNDSALAEDIMQESFLKAFSKLDSSSGVGALKNTSFEIESEFTFFAKDTFAKADRVKPKIMIDFLPTIFKLFFGVRESLISF